MIRKSAYIEQTDKYLNSELTHEELVEFEAQLALDSDLSEELALHGEVEQAVCEQDVINLRMSLNQIVQQEAEFAIKENINVVDSFSFGLADEFSVQKGLSHQITTEDLLGFGHSLPRIHLYQHSIAGKENIHQFYKEQDESSPSVHDESVFSPYEEELFAEVQTALEEQDITDIRANLKQIAQSIPSHRYSAVDIEAYLDGMMLPEDREQFEEELLVNVDLSREVALTREIDQAGAESDIMALRASLNAIQRSELPSSASIEELENYLHNELSTEEMASFEAELSSNKKLQEEIEFIRDIDAALSESDVMHLRSKLQGLSGAIAGDHQAQRSIAGRFGFKKIAMATVAASLILLLGLTGLLTRESSTSDIYHDFYTRYESSGTSRSAGISVNKAMAEALQKYEVQDYESALELFGQVLAQDPSNMASHFYSGVSLQETGKYSRAIEEYATVIVDKDNLFTEQAEWYTGLCYLQTHEEKKAIRQFRKIAQRGGFYQRKAQDLLKKIKTAE